MLKSVRATPATQVSVVGQNSNILEYNPEADATLRWEQKDQASATDYMKHWGQVDRSTAWAVSPSAQKQGMWSMRGQAGSPRSLR